MEVEQLIGRYLRLRHELALVLQALPFHRDRAKRLTSDLATTRDVMQQTRVIDEQTDDALGFATGAFLLPPSEFDDDSGQS